MMVDGGANSWLHYGVKTGSKRAAIWRFAQQSCRSAQRDPLIAVGTRWWAPSRDGLGLLRGGVRPPTETIVIYIDERAIEWLRNERSMQDVVLGRNRNGSCRGSSMISYSKHSRSGRRCLFGGGPGRNCRGAGLVAWGYGGIAAAGVSLFPVGQNASPLVGRYMEERFRAARRRCGGLGAMFGGRNKKRRNCIVRLSPG